MSAWFPLQAYSSCSSPSVKTLHAHHCHMVCYCWHVTCILCGIITHLYSIIVLCWNNLHASLSYLLRTHSLVFMNLFLCLHTLLHLAFSCCLHFYWFSLTFPLHTVSLFYQHGSACIQPNFPASTILLHTSMHSILIFFKYAYASIKHVT